MFLIIFHNSSQSWSP